jgi:hypothetical protein
MSYTRDKLTGHNWRVFVTSNVGGGGNYRGRIQSTESTTGQSVPKYRSIIKSGGNATSAYTRSAMLNVSGLTPVGMSLISEDVVFPYGIPKIITESAAGTWFPVLPSVGNINTADASTLALTKLYKRLAEQQTQFHGMQFLGELHQTISLLRRPFRTAGNLVSRYMDTVRKNATRYQPRRSLPGRQKFEKAIADSWLETAFGIRPLISDVKDAAKAALTLAYDSNHKRSRINASAQTFIDGNESSITVGLPGASILQLKHNSSGSMEHRVQFVAFLDWSRSAATGSMERVLEVSGFRPDLFVPTLYELAPWSFLVDYFTNLGTVIETGCQSQSAVTGCFSSSHAINSQRTIYYCLFPSSQPGISNSILGTPGSVTTTRRTFTRSNVSATIPSVPFQLSIPGKPTQYLNMIALWRSKMKSV